jgi:hypothetical protein
LPVATAAFLSCLVPTLFLGRPPGSVTRGGNGPSTIPAPKGAAL